MKNYNSKPVQDIIILAVLIAYLVFGTWAWAKQSEPEPETTETTVVETTVEHTTVDIPRTVVETTTQPEPTYTNDELFCMAAAIYNEAGSDSCSDDTRRMVGYVILNRVNDPRYPNTIRGVLLQYKQYGTFYKTGIKFADRASSPSEKHAVDRAYRIAKEVLETENIPIPADVLFQAEFIQGTKIYKHQDEMYFCHAGEVR